MMKINKIRGCIILNIILIGFFYIIVDNFESKLLFNCMINPWECITLDSIFMGFLLTIITIIWGFNSNPLIKELSETTIIDKKIQVANRSFICFGFSLAINFAILIIQEFISSALKRSLSITALIDIIIGIIMFAKVAIEVDAITHAIYKNNKKGVSDTIEKAMQQKEEQQRMLKITDENECE